MAFIDRTARSCCWASSSPGWADAALLLQAEGHYQLSLRKGPDQPALQRRARAAALPLCGNAAAFCFCISSLPRSARPPQRRMTQNRRRRKNHLLLPSMWLCRWLPRLFRPMAKHILPMNSTSRTSPDTSITLASIEVLSDSGATNSGVTNSGVTNSGVTNSGVTNSWTALSRISGPGLVANVYSIQGNRKATGMNKLNVGGGLMSVVYMWVTLDSSAKVPTALEHRIGVKVGKYPDTITVQCAHVAVGSDVAVISAPLHGDNWVAANGPANSSEHRRALIPIDGRAQIAQRFAIDWVRINPDGNTFVGDEKNNKNYRAYGSDALAVADGVVTEVKDGIPQNIPGENC